MKTYPKRIPITQPSITAKEINFVNKAIKSGWGKNAFSFIKRFEIEFAKYIGVKYAIATSSCTGALHLALLSLGIKSGDEVIIPDITWASTAFVVNYVGAKIIFADIDFDTWCIDPQDIVRKITKKTKAIIPVHLYGHPAEMERILKIAKTYNLYVIEDAAESIGAEYKGKKTGSMGDFSAFSFHGTKTLTTGEGGMLLTNNQKLFEKANFLNNMAKNPNKIFWNLDIGYKYKMTDMQAALGSAQLSRIDELIAKKKLIFSWYEKRLGRVEGLSLNYQADNCKNAYWMVTVIFDKKFKLTKKEIMKMLDQKNIDPRPFFYPLSTMPPFKVNVSNPVAYGLSEYGINLPCGHNISEKEVDYVCQVLLKIISTNRH